MGKTHWNKAKTAPNLIQFQFLVPLIIKDFSMFTTSNNE